MTKKKKLGILATALSLVVCVVLGGLLWWEMTKPERIEIPVPGLSWGMSADEVSEALKSRGVEHSGKVSVMSGDGFVEFGTMTLSAEQVQQLGMSDVVGISVSSNEHDPIVLRFVSPFWGRGSNKHAGDGVMRLIQVEICVEVEEGSSLEVNKQVNAALDKAYRKADMPGYWEIIGDEVKNIKVNGNSYGSYYSPDVHFSQKDCGIGEAVVVYCGAGYVEYLHGGTYTVKGSWR